jgi:mRNA interferase MazF
VCGVQLGRTACREQSGRRIRRHRSERRPWLLDTGVVVPTSTSARAATFRPEIVVEGRRTRVLCEQIRTLDARRIDAVVSTLSSTDLHSVEDALEIVLDL